MTGDRAKDKGGGEGVNYTPTETRTHTFVFLLWQMTFPCLYTEISVFIRSLAL